MGIVFSVMKTEYVVVAEQAHPLGPAYLIHNSNTLLTYHFLVFQKAKHYAVWWKRNAR